MFESWFGVRAAPTWLTSVIAPSATPFQFESGPRTVDELCSVSPFGTQLDGKAGTMDGALITGWAGVWSDVRRWIEGL